MEEHPCLPLGYCLDESDPDVLFLCREDGTVVAYFSASGATRETIEEAAWDDHKRRRKNRR